MPESTGGVAPPKVINFPYYGESGSWTWPFELNNTCVMAYPAMQPIAETSKRG